MILLAGRRVRDSKCLLIALFVITNASAWADITRSGDVFPKTHDGSDPWDVGGYLYVGNSSNGELTVDSGSQVLSANGYLGDDSGATGVVTVTGAGSTWQNTSRLWVGRSGLGILNINNGGLVSSGYLTAIRETNSTGTSHINFNNGTLNTPLFTFEDPSQVRGTGTINVGGTVADFNMVFDAPGAIFTGQINDEPEQDIAVNISPDVLSDFYVGYFGVGSLQVSGGAVLEKINSYVVSGSTTISGTDSSWFNTKDFSIGNASVRVELGGEITSTDGFVGYGVVPGNTSVATIAGSGSAWNVTDRLIVESSGDALVQVESGGQLTSKDAYVGDTSGRAGRVDVFGPGSNWTNNGHLFVGEDGYGLLNIESSGSVTTGAISISNSPGSSGTVVVGGIGSQLDTEFLLLGGRSANPFQNSGTGSLRIEDQGQVNASFGTFITEKPSVGVGPPTIHFDGGTLNTGVLEYTNTASLQGLGTINAGGITADLDLVFDATSNVYSTTFDDNPGQNILVNILPAVESDFFVGYEVSGSLLLTDGVSLTKRNSTVATQPGSIGMATVSGSGSIWTSSERLEVGKYGDGSLRIEDSGFVASDSFIILGDESGASGSVAVVGSGSRFNAVDGLYVGRDGSGDLTVDSGGEVSSGSVYIGFVPGSSGDTRLIGHGTMLSTNGIFVGYSGDGTLAIEDGANLSSTLARIGTNTSGTGSVSIVGPGSSWAINGQFYIGDDGDGSLLVDNGGVVTNTFGVIGSDDFGTGAVTVRGATSVWHNATGLYVGDDGTGTLTIEQGGRVRVDGTTWVDQHNTGHSAIIFDNGIFETGTLRYENPAQLRGTGTILLGGVAEDLDVVFDSQSVVQQYGVLDGEPDQNIALFLSPTPLSNFYVGYQEAGSLRVADGVVMTKLAGVIGSETGSTGVATVTGAGSTWSNTDEFYVGKDGIGSLRVEDSGLVKASDNYVGFSSTASGDVIVTGEGSSWISTNELAVGQVGIGELTIVDGGTVSNRLGYIGRASSATGVVTVTGSESVWNTEIDLQVGSSGQGTLNIFAGAKVNVGRNTIVDLDRNGDASAIVFDGGTLDTASLAYNGRENLSGSGTINVGGITADFHAVFDGTGRSHTFTLDTEPGHSVDVIISPSRVSDFHVGYFGSGSMLVTDGAVVDKRNGYIGNLAGATGIVTVTGPDSSWNTDELEVGGDGVGILNILNEGTVASTRRALVGQGASSSGTVVVRGSGSIWTINGSLTAGQGGLAELNIQDSGRLEAQSLQLGASGVLNVQNANIQIGGQKRNPFNQIQGEVNAESSIIELAGFTQIRPQGILALTGGGEVKADGDLRSEGLISLEISGHGGVAGTDYNHIDVSGELTFGGALSVTFSEDFTPALGDVFDLFTYTTSTGQFASIEFDSAAINGQPIRWDISSLYLTGEVRVAGLIIEGDYNGDGFVSQSDLDLVLLNWGDGVLPNSFDPNAVPGSGPFDGLIGQNDLDGVLLNWGAGSPPSTIKAIPEPTMLSFIALFLTSVGRHVRPFLGAQLAE